MNRFQEMFDELDSHKLEVQLVPLNPRLRNWNEGGMKRVVTDYPPKWYRLMCQRHTSSRAIRRGKHDTKIKRLNVLQLLARLAAGKTSWSKYAAELRRMAERGAA